MRLLLNLNFFGFNLIVNLKKKIKISFLMSSLAKILENQFNATPEDVKTIKMFFNITKLKKKIISNIFIWICIQIKFESKKK
ncbi:hypothetical protein BpHYR1_051560 [Brachionus plicatilis]|uniref:Uncharacterized protein n=1 Tax=Brachionus plicatilis TaxID=10195 RepID=A0A3M7RM56_BRAPC|nr:hypothetical protein BpHYR1_051560 [Brachionus plicatilis]